MKKAITLGLISLIAFGAYAKSDKRGVSENKFQYKAQMAVLEPGVSWFYNWSGSVGSYLADQEYMEFVPMCWNGNYNAESIRNYVKSHPDTKYLLGFNEPNFKEQANMTPRQAADKWPEVQALAKELGLKLVAPALNYSPDAPYQNPTTWMDEFVGYVGKDAFDYLALHNYGGFGVMKDLCTTFHNRYGKPIWVTEFCYWPGESGSVSAQQQINSMVESVEWLEQTDWIFRYAWFKATEPTSVNYHLIESGKGEDPRNLTEAGMVYVYLPEFDSTIYHAVNTDVAAVNYAARNLAGLGKGNNPSCPAPIEITAFNSGATLDYQFDIPNAGEYTLTMNIAGFGEPSRFDPQLQWVIVEGDKESALTGTLKPTLPNSDTTYAPFSATATLPAGKVTLRLKDMAPYSPSGIRISTVKVNDAAGIGAVASDGIIPDGGVYNLQGIRVADDASALGNLPSGLYIVGGKKVVK